ncbi:hypothetical protein EXIGLDRAFT_202223 [Exidia glandulosa HHB12029]|uniref:Secreted protein n=1 Tax=Exidia glandulosa HHB12029 TaxID=1314781 RepID=A0A165EQ22_EXIGL|nr:hypothetical protein EXIGLDRAFT_202223 [Exidia glandulosa HHB12029]
MAGRIMLSLIARGVRASARCATMVLGRVCSSSPDSDSQPDGFSLCRWLTGSSSCTVLLELLPRRIAFRVGLWQCYPSCVPPPPRQHSWQMDHHLLPAYCRGRGALQSESLQTGSSCTVLLELPPRRPDCGRVIRLGYLPLRGNISGRWIRVYSRILRRSPCTGFMSLCCVSTPRWTRTSCRNLHFLRVFLAEI